MKLFCKKCGNTKAFRVTATELNVLDVNGDGEFVKLYESANSDMADDYWCAKCSAGTEDVVVVEGCTHSNSREELLKAIVDKVSNASDAELMHYSDLVIGGTTTPGATGRFLTNINEDEELEGLCQEFRRKK